MRYELDKKYQVIVTSGDRKWIGTIELKEHNQSLVYTYYWKMELEQNDGDPITIKVDFNCKKNIVEENFHIYIQPHVSKALGISTDGAMQEGQQTVYIHIKDPLMAGE